VVKLLPRKHKAASSNPSTATTKILKIKDIIEILK
jgi:hypothetical protein